MAGSATRCEWRRRGGARPCRSGPEVAAVPAAGVRVARPGIATHLYRPRPAEAIPVQRGMGRSGATTFFRYINWYTQYLFGLNYTKIRYAINDILAERVGFEPTVQLPVLRFSRPALSSTQPSLREWNRGGFVRGSGRFVLLNASHPDAELLGDTALNQGCPTVR